MAKVKACLVPRLAEILKSKARNHDIDVDLVKSIEGIRSCTYRFNPMFRYWIPKGKNHFRPITQPHSSDVLILKSLCTLFNELDDQFHLLSHGFRPKRGVITLFRSLASWSSLVLIQRSDIVSCFDNIPHDLLLSRLQSFLGPKNPELLDLISSLLNVPILDQNGVNYASPSKGIPQGSPFSPILMNIVLHSIDVEMGRFVSSGELFYLRYADDIVLGFHNKRTIPRLILAFQKSLNDLKLQEKSSKVWRQEKKGSPHIRILGFICSITENGKIVTRAPFAKWKKKLSLTNILRDIKEKERTLQSFLVNFLLVIEPYIHFFSACPCSQSQVEFLSFAKSLLRKRSLEFQTANYESNSKEYIKLLRNSEQKLAKKIDGIFHYWTHPK
uniref:LtrA n=1 Tax=Utricularia reniformis TaxID=192314 RepID=A0A1Y0AZM1_9LAMI|nr:ltrA [Utricularia reniformis]ART30625.1 ltrA [Utricularia reniformis]